MPLPMPVSGETLQYFIARCMANKQLQKDFKLQSQRTAVCHSRFKKR